MRAVKEQREMFFQLSSDFAQRLKFHLMEIFTRHVSSACLLLSAVVLSVVKGGRIVGHQ